MRSYLLGALDEAWAARVEERYFADREFFLYVQRVEAELIEDYLAGELKLPEKRLFEERYLQLPELCQRVDEVRARIAQERRGSSSLRRWIPLAAAACLALVVVGILAQVRRGQRAGVQTASEMTQIRVVAALTLSPGLLKGASGAREVPAARAGVFKFTLQLPGRKDSSACVVKILRVGPESSLTLISETGAITPAQAADGQELRFSIDAALLGAGDYLAQAHGPEGRILDSYPFRITAR